MTDADIRAGLDGLIMALNIENWRTRFQTLKVSQILDMYYSPRGVFSQEARACNRYNQLNTVAPSNLLRQETIAFGVLFDNTATFPGTILDDTIPRVINKSVDLFYQYIRKCVT